MREFYFLNSFYSVYFTTVKQLILHRQRRQVIVQNLIVNSMTKCAFEIILIIFCFFFIYRYNALQ